MASRGVTLGHHSEHGSRGLGQFALPSFLGSRHAGDSYLGDSPPVFNFLGGSLLVDEVDPKHRRLGVNIPRFYPCERVEAAFHRYEGAIFQSAIGVIEHETLKSCFPPEVQVEARSPLAMEKAHFTSIGHYAVPGGELDFWLRAVCSQQEGAPAYTASWLLLTVVAVVVSVMVGASFWLVVMLPLPLSCSLMVSVSMLGLSAAG